MTETTKTESTEVDVDGKRHVNDPVVVDDRPGALKPVPIAEVSAHDRVDADDHKADRSKRPSDSEVTNRIRKAVTADDDLTAGAKNVKIVTQDGRVTLQGKVANDREKTAVDSYARQVAGDTNVDNQLVVK